MKICFGTLFQALIARWKGVVFSLDRQGAKMEQMKPQLTIVARVDRKALEDSDRVLVMKALLSDGFDVKKEATEDRVKDLSALAEEIPNLQIKNFENDGVVRFSRIVTFGKACVLVLLDVCENLQAFTQKADKKFITYDLPVFALVRSDSAMKRDKVHVAVRALGAWDNAMCALSLEDAAKLFDLDCDFYEDSPVRVATDTASRFYTSTLVAPGSAAFVSTCGASESDRINALVKVLQKASDILVRRWDIAMASVAEGKTKEPVA